MANRTRFKKAPDFSEDLKTIFQANDEFDGTIWDLEAAVGCLIVGRLMGWQAIRISHDIRTLAKYEKILGVKFKEVLPQRTVDSTRLKGIQYADKFGKFWQAFNAGLLRGPEAREIETA